MPHIKIPYSIGQTVYYIGTKSRGIYGWLFNPLCCTVTRLIWNTAGDKVRKIRCKTEDDEIMEFSADEFEEYVFLDHEKAAEELKGPSDSGNK